MTMTYFLTNLSVFWFVSDSHYYKTNKMLCQPDRQTFSNYPFVCKKRFKKFSRRTRRFATTSLAMTLYLFKGGVD
jgi:hypothetical protein